MDALRVDGHYDNGVGTSSAASQGVILGSLIQNIPLMRPGEVLEAVPGPAPRRYLAIVKMARSCSPRWRR